jgi:hypothetical protein
MSGHGDAAGGTSPRSDLIVAAVFLVFATAVVTASLAMPTFTDQGTPWFVAPGIVPGFHGLVLAVLAVVLAVRSIRRGALHAMPPGAAAAPTVRRIALATVLAVGFAAGLVGRLPFWLAATIFVFAFIMAFEWRRGMLARNAAIGLGIGLVTGIGITLIFERLFLIRMP